MIPLQVMLQPIPQMRPAAAGGNARMIRQMPGVPALAQRRFDVVIQPVADHHDFRRGYSPLHEAKAELPKHMRVGLFIAMLKGPKTQLGTGGVGYNRRDWA